MTLNQRKDKFHGMPDGFVRRLEAKKLPESEIIAICLNCKEYREFVADTLLLGIRNAWYEHNLQLATELQDMRMTLTRRDMFAEIKQLGDLPDVDSN